MVTSHAKGQYKQEIGIGSVLSDGNDNSSIIVPAEHAMSSNEAIPRQYFDVTAECSEKKTFEQNYLKPHTPKTEESIPRVI